MAQTGRLRLLGSRKDASDRALVLVPHTVGASVDGPAEIGTDASDAELVAAARRGERHAEAFLYRRHVRAVSIVAVTALGPGADAEDVVQDSFLTALERLGQLREPAQFRAWVVRIAVRHVHRRFRRRRLLRVLGFARERDDAVLPELAAPHVSAEVRAELARIDARLHELPPKLRIAWILRHVEGYELTEVAAACAISLATVKRWLGRAEAHVRTHARGEVAHG